MKLKPNFRNRGGALVIAVMTITILAATAAAVLGYVSSKYRNLAQAASWRKALVAAESGIDISLQTLTNSASDPSGAWTGWTTTDPATGTTLPYSGKCYTSTDLIHGGQGGNTMNFYVVVDVPTDLANPSPMKQCYRIRSFGYADLPGGSVVTNDALDVNLRKLSLRKDRKTLLNVAKPRASRIIEVIAAPETEIKPRNVAHVTWKMNGYKNDTRAFDSSDPTYSTGGKWDSTKQIPSTQAGVLLATNQWHKDYEKKGTIEKIDLDHGSVWGDFAALVGPVKHGENIKGETFTNQYTELPKVLAPTWTTLTDATITKIEGDPTSAQKAEFNTWYDTSSATMKTLLYKDKKSMVLRGGTSKSNPTKYKLTKLKLDNKDESLALANPVGSTESWIEIWTTEELKLKNGGTLAVENGVHATIHFQKMGKVKDTKNDSGGTYVESGFAGDLVLRGIEMDDSAKEVDADFSPVKTSGVVKIEDAIFTGVIYAPDYDLELKTRDPDKPTKQQYILGSVTGRKITLKGDTDFITDLAVTSSGSSVTGYRIASYYEDSE